MIEMPFYSKPPKFCQDRLGTNTGKALKKRRRTISVFCCHYLQVLRLENDLRASDNELEAMEGHLRVMKQERDEAVSYVGRDLPLENKELREQNEEQARAASAAARGASACQAALSQQLEEAQQRCGEQRIFVVAMRFFIRIFVVAMPFCSQKQ